MYRQHFGIAESPFNITPNPAFFYRGNTRGELLNALLYAVTHGEGIVKVTGEVGSGKTMLCRMLETMLPDNVVVLYLVNPSLGPDEVLYAIAGELSLDIGQRRADAVLRLLQDDLIAKHVAGKRVVLLVEEAQAMPLATLEEIRLLTNLETARDKLLQIVLFGQPELDQNLAQPGMRQLTERITHRLTVPPMDADLVGDFLAFRLAAAGYKGPPLFDAAAAALIADASKGIVRRINILADKALLAAFADDAFFVRVKHVEQAMLDSGYRRSVVPAARRPQVWAVGVALLALLLVWQVLQQTGVLRATRDQVARYTTNIEPPAQYRAPATVKPATAPAPPVAPAIAAAAPKPAATESVNGAVNTAPTAPAPSLLDATLAQTVTWLDNEAPHNLTLRIALLRSDNRPGIEQYLRSTQAAIGLDQIHVYPATVNGEARIVVAYGRFVTAADAANVQRQLVERAGFRPEVVSVETIREQVRQAQTAP